MKKLLILLLLLGVAGSACASVDWLAGATTSDWFTAANWSNGVPVLTPTTNTRTYGSSANPSYMPIINSGAAVAHQLDIGGGARATQAVTGSVTLNGSTSTLTVTDYFRTGSSSTSNRWGAFYMNDGTVNVGNYLTIGYGSGTVDVRGWLDMNAGTINVTNAFTIGNAAGASGYVDLDGGTINAGNFVMKATAGTGTVELDIWGSKIVITGDKTVAIQGYIDNAWIKSNGVAWTLYDNVSYDVGTNKTTIIPEPATLCLLGLGALSLIRRKR